MPGNILTISYEKPTQRYTRYLLYAVIEMLSNDPDAAIINEFAQAGKHYQILRHHCSNAATSKLSFFI